MPAILEGPGVVAVSDPLAPARDPRHFLSREQWTKLVASSTTCPPWL
ncbi:MAG TPA: hypothetical protein VGL02_12880 [Streptomyces sp.]